MGDKTGIEWTDATWNPITGCRLVSEGCRHCYAARLAATRLKHLPSRKGLARLNAAGEAKFTGEVRFNEEWLTQPLKWRRPRKIFVCAHGDLFAEGVPDEWIDKVFAVMADADRHTYQVLTKRPDRMCRHANDSQTPVRIARWIKGNHKAYAADSAVRVTWPLPNVWLGTSCEDQATADERVPLLLDTPAAIRFVSAEPLLGPIDLLWALNGHACQECADWGSNEDGECDHSGDPGYSWKHAALTQAEYSARPTGAGLPELGSALIKWVIVGGESGPHARPMHPDWARSLRDQCATAGVPFFFKQWGEWARYTPVAGADLGGEMRAGRIDIVHREEHEPAELLKRSFFKGDCYMRRVGKKAAGALLDGREWRQFPEAA
jgi:protein gp37